MDQAIWVIFGVIAVVITFGIIAKLIVNTQDDMKFQHVLSSMDKLEGQCNYVCNQPVGTRLSVPVELASGINLTMYDNSKICAIFPEKITCVRCDCKTFNYTLDLTSAMARNIFFTHTYDCYFERLQNGIEIECQG